MKWQVRAAELWVVVMISATLIASVGYLALGSGPTDGRDIQNGGPSAELQLTATAAQVSALEITSPNNQLAGEFGSSVAISGTMVVVGAPSESSAGHSEAGNAYVFDAQTGALISTLTSPNAQVTGGFGCSVAISGETVVVGAFGEEISGHMAAGHAYTFNAKTGVLISRFHSPNVGTNGEFGLSVGINGTTVVVGAGGENASGFVDAGHAYTFSAKTGALISTLTSPNAQNGGGFGISVGVSATTVVVGAMFETALSKDYAGRAYTFNATTGVLVSTLTSPNLQAHGQFGNSVAIDRTTVVVGASRESYTGGLGDSGHAYTFNATTGAAIARLHSPNAQSYGYFGTSVAVSGTEVVIGAPQETVQSFTTAGRAYTFNATTGKLISTVNCPNAQTNVQFGLTVAMSGKIVAVGAPTEYAFGVNAAGATYLF
jgi:hypothetical protein